MRALVLVWLAASCGGQYHVKLDPPRPGITPEERVATFWKLRPTATGFVTTNKQLTNRTMFLGDKQQGVEQIEVVSPEDLEPLVGSDSETMQHARRSIAARHSARRWYYAGYVALAAGLIGAVVISESTEFGSGYSTLTFIAAGGTALVLGSIGRRSTREELAWRAKAFEAYPRDLGVRLDVCAHGTQVVPCEAPVDAPSEPQPPATTTPGSTALLRMR